MGVSHQVELRISSGISVARKDIEIDVTEGGSRLGTLKISQGSLDWWPANRSVNFHRLKWARFAELIAEGGEAVRKDGAPSKTVTRRKPAKKVAAPGARRSGPTGAAARKEAA